MDIPNGVDTARFAPATAAERTAARQRLGLPHGGRLTTFVGFWSREKGPHVVLDAWLRTRGSDDALLFLGATDPSHLEVNRELLAEARDRIAAAGVDAQVRFVEHSDDVASILKASDIFAVPSAREGMSNALLEAMATGLPCVTGRIAGVSDALIDEGVNGFAVTPGDAGGLADIFRRLSADDVRASVGARARATVVERFALEAVARRYIDLYAELML